MAERFPFGPFTRPEAPRRQPRPIHPLSLSSNMCLRLSETLARSKSRDALRKGAEGQHGEATASRRRSTGREQGIRQIVAILQANQERF